MNWIKKRIKCCRGSKVINIIKCCIFLYTKYLIYPSKRNIYNNFVNNKNDVNVNLGCGSKHNYRVSGFIGIDINSYADIRMYLGNKSIPFYNETVDFIYSSHFFEHVNKNEAIYLIQECYRILKKGGMLKITVPDLKLFTEKYVKDDQSFFDKNRWPGETLADQFNYVIRSMGHSYMYDYPSLKYRLKKAGFANVNRSKFDDSIDKAKDVSLFIEGIK